MGLKSTSSLMNKELRKLWNRLSPKSKQQYFDRAVADNLKFNIEKTQQRVKEDLASASKLEIWEIHEKKQIRYWNSVKEVKKAQIVDPYDAKESQNLKLPKQGTY